MPIFSGALASFTAIGNREDLTDKIYQISPEERPLLSAIGKGKAKAAVHEWQTDALAAAADNVQLEGDVVGYTTPAVTTRLGNNLQTSYKTASVTSQQEAIEHAGRGSELAYQMSKRSTELLLDLERHCFQNYGGITGASGTAARAAALLAYIKTNVVKGTTTAANPTYTSGVPTGATGRTRATAGYPAFTEANLKLVLALCYTAGAKPNSVFMSMTNMQKAANTSTWAGTTAKYQDVASSRPAAVVGAVNRYVWEGGLVDFIPDRYADTLDVFVLDTKFLEIDYLQGVKQEPMAKTGLTTNRVFSTIWTLKVKNEAAHGLLTDVQ